MKEKKNREKRTGARVIDWQDVYSRVQAAYDIEDMRATPQYREKVLKERAKKLAAAVKKEVSAEQAIEVVEFVLASETYAVESRYVREIFPMYDITPVPCTPSFVLGIINVRGQILSVIDIKKFFDLPERGITDLNKVIILKHGDMEFGILADSISGVAEIRKSELETGIPTLTGVREGYLKGVTRERVVVLDAVKLLTDKSVIVHDVEA